MNIADTYDYLMRARRDLWAVLAAAPDELLSRPLAGDDWFSCLKDLVFHIATVEDGWIHGDILREEPVLMNYPTLRDAEEGAACGFALAALLDYWRVVEQSTLIYLAALTDEELNRIVTVEDWPPQHQRFKLDGLLWHVVIHEMRHTAQIVVLLRSQGIKPPSLDLLFYLPST